MMLNMTGLAPFRLLPYRNGRIGGVMGDMIRPLIGPSYRCASIDSALLGARSRPSEQGLAVPDGIAPSAATPDQISHGLGVAGLRNHEASSSHVLAIAPAVSSISPALVDAGRSKPGAQP